MTLSCIYINKCVHTKSLPSDPARRGRFGNFWSWVEELASKEFVSRTPSVQDASRSNRKTFPAHSLLCSFKPSLQTRQAVSSVSNYPSPTCPSRLHPELFSFWDPKAYHSYSRIYSLFPSHLCHLISHCLALTFKNAFWFEACLPFTCKILC